MAEAKSFIKEINRLSMQMTHTRRKKDGKKERKRVLRLMKKQVSVVCGHAERYRTLLDGHWQATDWSRPQAEQVLKRIDEVLEALPAAVNQAHERIIGERPVANAEKILSLFEPDLHVIVRGKAGEEVEFGNLLILGEQRDGLITDWELFKEQGPADARLVRGSVERVETALGQRIDEVAADRGFDSKGNLQWLEKRGTFSAICPRNPGALRAAMQDDRFAQAQRRRAQTEARVAIFKNEFLGRPMRAEGFENRNLQVAWGVLTHDLWVVARKLRDQRQARETKEEPKRARLSPNTLSKMRRLVHKPVALAWRQRRSSLSGAPVAATSPCRGVYEQALHFSSSYLISFLLNLTHRTLFVSISQRQR